MATANATRRIRVKAPRPTLQQAIILALSDLPPVKCKPVRMDNGVPVYRFKKQIIRCGNFTTADGQPFEVTPKTLKSRKGTSLIFPEQSNFMVSLSDPGYSAECNGARTQDTESGQMNLRS